MKPDPQFNAPQDKPDEKVNGRTRLIATGGRKRIV